MTVPLAARADAGLEGAYAGIATRAVAFWIDVVTIAVVFAGGEAVVERIVGLFLGRELSLSDSQLASSAALAAWAFLYFAYPLAVAGRTLGMAVLGLRAVAADGHDLSSRRAVVRVIALPLSFLLFGLGFALIVLRRDHRALHDLLSGAAVVYSWKARAAHLRFLVRHL